MLAAAIDTPPDLFSRSDPRDPRVQEAVHARHVNDCFARSGGGNLLDP